MNLLLNIFRFSHGKEEETKNWTLLFGFRSQQQSFGIEEIHLDDDGEKKEAAKFCPFLELLLRRRLAGALSLDIIEGVVHVGLSCSSCFLLCAVERSRVTTANLIFQLFLSDDVCCCRPFAIQTHNRYHQLKSVECVFNMSSVHDVKIKLLRRSTLEIVDDRLKIPVFSDSRFSLSIFILPFLLTIVKNSSSPARFAQKGEKGKWRKKKHFLPHNDRII